MILIELLICIGCAIWVSEIFSVVVESYHGDISKTRTVSGSMRQLEKEEE